MIAYVFLSGFLAVLGVAVVVAVVAIVIPRARRQRELDRRRAELASEQELTDYIEKLDQATSRDEIDHLDNERGDG